MPNLIDFAKKVNRKQNKKRWIAENGFLRLLRLFSNKMAVNLSTAINLLN